MRQIELLAARVILLCLTATLLVGSALAVSSINVVTPVNVPEHEEDPLSHHTGADIDMGGYNAQNAGYWYGTCSNADEAYHAQYATNADNAYNAYSSQYAYRSTYVDNEADPVYESEKGGLVPYTGATTDIDLGTKNLTTTGRIKTRWLQTGNSPPPDYGYYDLTAANILASSISVTAGTSFGGGYIYGGGDGNFEIRSWNGTATFRTYKLTPFSGRTLIGDNTHALPTDDGTSTLQVNGNVKTYGNLVTTGTINGGNLVTTGTINGLTPSTFLTTNTYIQPANAFSGTTANIPGIFNILYTGDKRFIINQTGFLNPDSTKLFDNDFETWGQNRIANGTSATITIDLTKEMGVNGKSYSGGSVYVSFYYTWIANITSARFYSNYYHTWYNVTPAEMTISGNHNGLWKIPAPGGATYNTLIEINMSVAATAPDNASLVEIEYVPNRPTVTDSFPYINKFADDFTYKTLTFRQAVGNNSIILNAATGAVTAYSFVDLTPAWSKSNKDATTAIKNIKTKVVDGKVEVDHDSLDPFLRTEIPITRNVCVYGEKAKGQTCTEEVVGTRPGRILNNMVDTMAHSQQDLIARIEQLEAYICGKDKNAPGCMT